jgi:ketosteroid isomerase-like protein
MAAAVEAVMNQPLGGSVATAAVPAAEALRHPSQGFPLQFHRQPFRLTETLFAATMVPGGQADEPAPEKQVAALSEQHRLAAIQGDTKVLDAVLADDWVVVGPTGAVDTKRQQEKKLKDKSLVFEAIDPQEVKVRVHGDAALVMGLYHIKATLNGRTVAGVFRNTGVFTKQAGRWRCVFNQVTPVARPPAETR